jgi:hypothetical protein
MKRFSLFSLAGLVLFGIVFLPPAFSQTNETLTISTYYPSPYGVYSEMRLYPKADTTCNPDQIGLMYYDNTPGEEGLKVCGGSPLGWQGLGGYWTLLGNNLYPTNTTSWNVGIGMTSPGTKLSVRVDGNGANAVLRLSSILTNWNAGYGPRLLFHGGTDDRPFGEIGSFLQNTGTGANAYMTFSTRDAETIAERVRITSTGNVGIGTTNPSAKLTVQGGADDVKLKFYSNGGSVGMIDAVSLNDGTTRWLSINPSGGNVGIGTTNPSAKLTVQGGADDVKLKFYSNGGSVGMIDAVSLNDGTTRWLSINPSGGNVGIGTTGPWVNLHVRGNMNVEPTTTGNWQGLNAYNPNVGFWSHFPWGGDGWNYLSGNGTIFRHPSYGNTAWIRYDGSAYFNKRIGTQAYSPDDTKGLGGGVTTWDVIAMGGLYVFSGNTMRVLFQNNGGGWMQGYLSQGSDIRDKKNIAPMADTLKRILTLNGVYFQWKDPQIATSRQMGLIAQEVEKVFPEVVSEGPDGKKSVAYGNLAAALIEAIKELKTQNDAAQKRIQAMEAKIADLEKRRIQ